MNNMNIDAIKKAMMRTVMVAYKMGQKNGNDVSEYVAGWELGKLVDEVGNEIARVLENGAETPKANRTAADYMDTIAASPERFLKGLTVKDRYPRVNDRDSYTIIKVEPVDTFDEKVYGVLFQKDAAGFPVCIVMNGRRTPGSSSGYVSGKEYREVEIPTWVLNG